MAIIRLKLLDGENNGKFITCDPNKVTKIGSHPKNDLVLKGE